MGESNNSDLTEREKRIKAITRLYYSNPKIQQVLLEFSANREVVPSYLMQSFGKRPDIIQYPSDITGLVMKGATSFHGSEEIWEDPLKLSSELSQDEVNNLRKSWDLLIDIDSKYLDYSKMATKLILEALEVHGIKNYGIKFSGSRGFHIIVSGKAFPDEYEGNKMKEMFPEWPRAISEYIIAFIRPKYNELVGKQEIDFKALEERTKLSKKDITEVICPQCNRPSNQGQIITLKCPDCKNFIQRKNMVVTKRKLRCVNEGCFGLLEVSKSEPYYYCEYCKISNMNPSQRDESKTIVYAKDFKQADNQGDSFMVGIAGNKLAGLDTVLVSPRHLFRMPYSLHEKTALCSRVLFKEELENFSPKMADPLSSPIRKFLPDNKSGEGTRLLDSALSWKKKHQSEEEVFEKKKYVKKDFDVNLEGINENMFPQSIKILLKGLQDGKKRGLFVLITFLKSLNYSYEYVNLEVREWNKRNEHPLKEGYIKSQVDWHFKQKRKILPPNYDNENFYKDLGLIKDKPKAKNPLVEVMRNLYKSKNNSS
ncbi:hypothetical protein COU54_01810 [Candidatus Pacearchaeota archaeon CG10_big_fil_rev_8_21_14_0_10_31_24]|nr:MAG: hypothetical protein COU54_01810 [Candidatus Pacearchaeota archaeon CG10_big_fil_rev_8_21_14_0_10_31_24]